MGKKLFKFFICLTIAFTLIGCTAKDDLNNTNTGSLTEGELHDIIKSIYKDCTISYTTENSIKILDIKVNVPKSSRAEELEAFTNACDLISNKLEDITYYSGIMYTLQVDGEDKACIRSYTSDDGKFKLESTYIEDDEYKQ